MKSYPARPLLPDLHIAALPAINALPLVHGLPGSVSFGHPAELVEYYDAGKAEVALLPVAAILARGWEQSALPNLGIAAHGPAYSVYVTYPGSEKDVRSIFLDPASLSSVALLRILQRHFGHLGGGTWEECPRRKDADALLLIGDEAINYRRKHTGSATFVDLAELWHRHTGLPFVFALWVVHPSQNAHRANIAWCLHENCRQNLAHLSTCFPPGDDPSFWQHYFAGLHYRMGEADHEAIRLFAHLGKEHQLFSNATTQLQESSDPSPPLQK